MTDAHSDPTDDGSLPELTPEQESEVRRRLAEARHEDPIPPDVATRLDAALVDLSREERGSPELAPVIDLAARRRRRNAAAVLAGAAAVIVAGFAIGQVIDVGGTDDKGSSSSDVAADRGVSGSADSGRTPSEASQDAAPSAAAVPTKGTLLRLRSSHLERDLTVQLDRLSSSTGDPAPDSTRFSSIGCSAPTPSSKFGLGELFPALFDGKPAVVALRPPADGRREADVLTCGGATTLQSVSLPAH